MMFLGHRNNNDKKVLEKDILTAMMMRKVGF